MTPLYNDHTTRGVVPVSCLIEEDIKNNAEAILQRLGVPVSVAIGSLYRQIIARNGFPFPRSFPDRIILNLICLIRSLMPDWSVVISRPCAMRDVRWMMYLMILKENMHDE